MVRLVFRPYTQVWRTICTSVTLRASTRVSPGFTLLKCSSPSFGSYQICSYSIPSFENQGWLVLPPCGFTPYTHFRYAFGFFHPKTRIWGRLLGPCFKTGRWKPFLHNLQLDPQAKLRIEARVFLGTFPGALTSLCISLGENSLATSVRKPALWST